MASIEEHYQVLMFKAKLADIAQRYEDSIKFLKEAIQIKPGLNLQELRLLSKVYANLLLNRRNSIRMLSSLQEQKGNEAAAPLASKWTPRYRAQLEMESKMLCAAILGLLNIRLIPNASEPYCAVYLLKIKGDFYAQLAEVCTGKEQRETVDEAVAAYKMAGDLADEIRLPAFDPIRLKLATNSSYLYIKLLDSPISATDIAKSAIRHADSEKEGAELPDETELQLALLRHNISHWNEYFEEEEEEVEEDESSASEAKQEAKDESIDTGTSAIGLEVEDEGEEQRQQEGDFEQKGKTAEKAQNKKPRRSFTQEKCVMI